MKPMTQRSESCGRAHSGTASEVPFPWLKRVRFDHECDSEVLAHFGGETCAAKGLKNVTDLYTNDL